MSSHATDQPFEMEPSPRETAALAFHSLNGDPDLPLSRLAHILALAIDRATWPDQRPHVAITVPVEDHGAPAFIRVCDCGFLSLPAQDIRGLDTICPLDLAERQRRVRAESVDREPVLAFLRSLME